MSGQLVQPTVEYPILRPQVGLMLSIGEPPTTERNYPKKLDHFRPKPGSEGQFEPAVERFVTKYGATPKVLDILFLSNSVEAVLDIRYLAWGTSGLKARGHTNFALDPDGMGGPDKVTAYPENSPTAREGEITGLDDEKAVKLELKLYGSLFFALEGVTGLTTLAQITTTSRRSMMNMLSGITQILSLTGGQMAGIPLELAVRPARTRYFDEKKKKRSTSTFYELVLQAPGAIDEFFEKARVRREQMQAGKPLVLAAAPDAEAFFKGTRIEAEMAQLPAAPDEPVALRDDPGERASDAVLNRIARLTATVGEAGALMTLRGVFGVDRPEELDGPDADRYARMLEEAAGEAPLEVVEADEIIDADPEPEPEPVESPYKRAARKAAGE